MLDKSIRKIYMVGIKGTGMSSMAVILKKMGYHVTGSDMAETFFTESQLKTNKIPYFEGFDEKNIRSAKPDLVITSTAYNERNKEISEAKLRRMHILTYPEALGEISRTLTSVAVCGSHGKTTTTSILGALMQTNNTTVTLAGSVAEHLLNNTKKPEFFVFEADEYQDKLQYYNPQYVILTNVDFDHPDYFKDKKHYTKTFDTFIDRILKQKGFVLYNLDDRNSQTILKDKTGSLASFGFNKKADYQITNTNSDQTSATIMFERKPLCDLSLSVYGRHNILNAAASAIMAHRLGIPIKTIESELPKFTGVKRRMELIPSKNYILIDDYGHHPTEVQATLQALRTKYQDKHIVAVFHPHTFTRTKALLKEFGASFKDADLTIVLDIYPSAREIVMDDIHTRDVVREINSNKSKAIYQPTIPDAAEYIQHHVPKGSVVITIGAGDVWKLCNIIK